MINIKELIKECQEYYGEFNPDVAIKYLKSLILYSEETIREAKLYIELIKKVKKNLGGKL